MPGSGRKGKKPGPWLRLVVAGVATLATAAGADGNGRSVTADGPSGCVVLKRALPRPPGKTPAGN
jgi:hypothetical protein